MQNEEADVVYKLKGKNEFFLIEHQSKVDYRMPFRILKYEMAIIESAIESDISILLYIGNQIKEDREYLKDILIRYPDAIIYLKK